MNTDVQNGVSLFCSTAMVTSAAYEIMKREGEEGYAFRRIFTVIFTNLIISKEEQDESSLCIKPDSPIRPTIPQALEDHLRSI